LLPYVVDRGSVVGTAGRVHGSRSQGETITNTSAGKNGAAAAQRTLNRDRTFATLPGHLPPARVKVGLQL